METHGVVLSLHGEVTDRRRRHLRSRARVRRAPLARDRPRLPGAEDRARAHHDHGGRRVRRARRATSVAATITPQHLLYSRNALFAGGLRPHLYCLPILKREAHRRGAGRRRDVGQPEILPRHRFGAARAAHEGDRVLRRRLLLGARSRSSSTPKRSRTPARSTGSRLREPLRRRLLRPAAQRRTRHARARAVDRARRLSVRRRPLVPLRAGETMRWRGARPTGTSGRRGAILDVRSQPDRRRPRRCKLRGERKVRAPQSRMPGNARPL